MPKEEDEATKTTFKGWVNEVLDEREAKRVAAEEERLKTEKPAAGGLLSKIFQTP